MILSDSAVSFPHQRKYAPLETTFTFSLAISMLLQNVCLSDGNEYHFSKFEIKFRCRL